MQTKESRTFVTICIGIIISLASLQVAAQKGPTVTVDNTPANPVPVTGGVAITNAPTVDARQSGTWNVGITGTPTVQLDSTANTVKIDPTANIVKFDRLKSFQRAEQVDWTGQGSAAWTTNGTDAFEKISVCVAHTGPNPIQVNVFSLVIGADNAFFFTRDAFIIGSPNTVCKLYDLARSSFQVQLANTGNNTTGLARVGIVGR